MAKKVKSKSKAKSTKKMPSKKKVKFNKGTPYEVIFEYLEPTTPEPKTKTSCIREWYFKTKKFIKGVFFYD